MVSRKLIRGGHRDIPTSFFEPKKAKSWVEYKKVTGQKGEKTLWTTRGERKLRGGPREGRCLRGDFEE